MTALAASMPGFASGEPTTSQVSPEPELVRRYVDWGFAYHHFRHKATARFKGPNVRQEWYEFKVRTPLFKSSLGPKTQAPLVVLLHARSGDFNRHERSWTDHVVLLPDDNTEGIGHTGWFGYHDRAPEPPKRDSVVVPYTQRRLVYTIRFVVEEFGCDPHRVWACGGSMGGGGALLLAMHHPEWIAGAYATKPPIDLRACPALRSMAEKLFGPREWQLRVEGTQTSVWLWTSLPWLLARRSPWQPWLQIRHGRMDAIVPFMQYFTSLSPPGRSFWQMLEHDPPPGVFVWDLSGHEGGDPIGTWRSDFNALSTGLVRKDKPVMAFFDPSLGHLGVPKRLGKWKTQQTPQRHPRGVVNAFCRWDPDTIVDRPDRFEVRLWLSGEGAEWQRCPVEEMTYTVSPRWTRNFAVPPETTFAYRVLPEGPSGRVTSDDRGRLAVPRVPIRRGRARAVRLQLRYAMPTPIVSVTCPSHPTSVPRPATTVVATWTVANSTLNDPMPVDRYRCWLAKRPDAPAPEDCETTKTERVFESVKPGGYTLMVQARLVTGSWGPVTMQPVFVDPSSPVK